MSCSYVMYSPLEDVTGLMDKIRKSDDRSVEVKISDSGVVSEPVVSTNPDGSKYYHKVDSHIERLIPIATVSRDLSGKWKVEVDRKIPSRYVDIELYIECWDNCYSDDTVIKHLNYIYNKLLNIDE